MVYLPVTLAAELGQYEAAGLDVRLENLQSGSKALQALLGGSADVVSGFHDHTIQMAAEGRPLRSFVLMLRTPGLAVLAGPRTSGRIRRVADLGGATVGVTALGSATHFFLTYLLAKHGVEGVSAIGVGGNTTALAALEQGKVDAVVITDPAATVARERNPGLSILADTRDGVGTEFALGSPVAYSSVLYAPAAWLDAHPDKAARLAGAIRATLEWMASHSADEIAARMPAALRGEYGRLYAAALQRNKASFSPDGRFEAAGVEAVHKSLSLSLPKVKEARINLSDTYTNQFLP